MHQSRKNQQGFTAIETVLILIIIAIIGFIGWYAWYNNHKAVSMSASSSKSISKPNLSAGSANPLQKFLVVKEWDVKVAYTSDDTLTYSYNAGNPVAIDVISAHLAKEYGCTTMGAGEIFRGKGDMAPPFPHDPNDTSFPSTIAELYQRGNGSNQDMAHVGDYYYWFLHDQAACTGNWSKYPGLVKAQNTANDFVENLVSKLVAE